MVEHSDSAAPKQLPPINLVLRELAMSESGVSFIYSALNVVAQRYGLSDVAIILVSSSISTRVFRLDGRDTDTNAVAGLGTSPGVYCLPDIVPQDELETIYSTCQEAYSHRFVRNIPPSANLESGDDDRTSLVPTPFVESMLDADPADGVTTTAKRVRQVSRREPSARAQSARVVISRLLVLIDITTLVLTAVGFHGPLRLVLGLVLGVVIPGWCIVAPLRLDNAALELGLIMTVSLSLLMMVAQILMTLGLWHLVALEEITCVVCLPFLLIQSKLVTLWSPDLAVKSTPSHTKMPKAS
jgi:hypothetical protein